MVVELVLVSRGFFLGTWGSMEIFLYCSTPFRGFCGVCVDQEPELLGFVVLKEISV